MSDFILERYIWYTVNLNKRAIGCPRIDSAYKDAAELIFSTTK
jgi:hypothetical protein